MTWLVATADELDALARRLGADRFPGVERSIFDELPAELHPLLAERFVATLTARDLVVLRDDGLVLAPGASSATRPSRQAHRPLRTPTRRGRPRTTSAAASAPPSPPRPAPAPP